LFFQENGFVVFAAALSEGECEEAIALLWDWLEEVVVQQQKLAADQEGHNNFTSTAEQEAGSSHIDPAVAHPVKPEQKKRMSNFNDTSSTSNDTSSTTTTTTTSTRSLVQRRLLDRDDPSTWDLWPEGVEGGILPYFGAGQSHAAWFVRGKPKVVAFLVVVAAAVID
jgi:hypothetical protein